LLGILPFDTSGVSRAIPFSLVQTTVCDGSCLAKPADDGRTGSLPGGGPYIKMEFPTLIFLHVLLATAQVLKAPPLRCWTNSPLGWLVVPLL